jgi:hypothetical protein
MNEELEVISEEIDEDSKGITADDWVEFVGNYVGTCEGLDRPINRF